MFVNPSSKKSKSATAPRRRQVAESTRETTTDSSASQYSFRRNRTLTGSSSPKIRSTNELNAEIKSPRAHVHHLVATRRKLGLYLACVVLVSSGLYFLLSQFVASTVVQIDNNPLDLTEQAPYQVSLDSYYASRPVERLRFVLNDSDLLSHMQASHPEIKTIAIEPGGNLGEATVGIGTRDAVARWTINGRTRFVDAQGVVFDTNYGTLPSIRIVDNSGLPTTKDGTVASDRFLGFIGRIIAQAKKSDVTVTRITIPTLTTKQVIATIEGSKTEYRLSVDRSAGEQAEDIGRVMRYLERRNLSPKYVDIRLKGKAYYR